MSRPLWLELAEIKGLHVRALRLAGGAEGLRDPGGLESALARPRWAHRAGTTSLHALAALYTAGVSAAHAYLDGNKRTAFLTGMRFLDVNGVACDPPAQEAIEAVVALTTHAWDVERYAAWLESHGGAPTAQSGRGVRSGGVRSADRRRSRRPRRR